MFTENEINWLEQQFNQTRICPNAPDAIAYCENVQNILGKMKALRKETYELTSLENGTNGDADKHEQPNGNREAKAAGQGGAVVPQ